ncbi:MAG: hypothetical protein WBQ14_09105 [Gaiellaceae bacterium]
MSLKGEIKRVPGAEALWRKLKPLPDAFPETQPSAADYRNPIAEGARASDLIRSLLESPRPCLCSRLGANELNCVKHYLTRRGRRAPEPYPENIRYRMHNNAGFFPIDDESLDAFASEYLSAFRSSDILGVWMLPGEDRLARKQCPAAKLVTLGDLSAPYFNTPPWSVALSGKRVLVIHPFAESIAEQYERNRERLWNDPDVLPAFDLQVMKAVQSIADEPTEFATWFDALGDMKARMDALDFDVCLVGAGAYGPSLAAHAKRLGNKGVMLGGATQILFGIRGKRWDEREDFVGLFNDYWVRAKPSEVPTNSNAVEDGCYW